MDPAAVRALRELLRTMVIAPAVEPTTPAGTPFSEAVTRRNSGAGKRKRRIIKKKPRCKK